ncbi:hypothetical protein LCGC14_0362480 [marine sediment metagenome]|uniref:Uncharacterized protein n=1 Tax=marine sediment metagenome TaxID=412755 RepID=A0A0F9T7W2_9ZZZZ
MSSMGDTPLFVRTKWKCVNCEHEVEIVNADCLDMGIAECEKCGIKGLRKVELK